MSQQPPQLEDTPIRMTFSISPHDRLSVVAGLLSGQTVLDVGGREGLLAKLTPATYFAVDIQSQPVIAVGRYALAQAVYLPFKEASFQSVTCIAVLQYVSDVRSALTEFRRVVVPGGQVIVQVPNFAYARRRIQLLRGHLPQVSSADNWSTGTVRHFTLSSLRDLVSSVGYEIRSVRCSGKFRHFREHRPELFGGDLILELEVATA